MYRYIKALAALIGGVAPLSVVGVLAVLGVHVDPMLVIKAAVLGSPVLSVVAVFLAPKNAEKKAEEDRAAGELSAEASEAIELAAQRAVPEPPAIP